MRTSTFTTMVIDSLLTGRSSIAGGPGNEPDRRGGGGSWMHARQTLRNGVSTRNDVILAFGDPQEATREDGRQICVWKPLPAASPTLTVYFDDDDLVVDYRIA